MDAEETLDKICSHFGVDKNELLRKNKTKEVSTARGFAYYALHYGDAGLSARQIAVMFGRNSVRGVKHIISTMKYLIENHSKYIKEYERFLDR